MNEYIYDSFDFSAEYKERLIEFLKHQCNAEIGGYRLFDGERTHMMQSPWELADFIVYLKSLEVEKRIKFRHFLEIGYASGTLNTILHKFFQFEKVVAVDLNNGNINSNQFRANFLHKNFRMISGDSTDQSVLDDAKLLGPYDLIFIDANHTYEFVKADFLNYSKLLRDQAGVIGFHDVRCPDWPGVEKAFEEMGGDSRVTHKSVFVQEGFPIQYGIGALELGDI